MTSYCSPTFLGIFLPAVMIVYNIVPQKHRGKALLVGSYVFYALFSGKLVVFLLISTFSIHHFGLWLAQLSQESRKVCAALAGEEKKEKKGWYKKRMLRVAVMGVLLQFAVLITLKYTPFFGGNLNMLLAKLGVSFQFVLPKFVLPLGISFYTMQAASYLLDIYHGKLKADENLGRVALYMSFFPQIMEGSICRYNDTARQLWAGNRITYENLTFGAQRILYGVMKEVVVVWRLNMLVEEVFSNYARYDGGVIAIASVCFTIQLYMDFSGTMDIVIGVGEIFGICMPENFRQPFFARSISDFWARWHISLGTWFRDYIFYPVSMARPMKKLTLSARKKIGNHFGPLIAGSAALFLVWSCNGLWHGAAWSYLFFGMYHFGLILLGNLFEPAAQRIADTLGVDRQQGKGYRVFAILGTVFLVNIGELFFRAPGLRAGLTMFGKMLTDFTITSVADGKVFTLGTGRPDFLMAGIVVVIVFTVSVLKERGVRVRRAVSQWPLAPRWALWLGLIMFVIIFGAYGAGYEPIDPMYANF